MPRHKQTKEPYPWPVPGKPLARDITRLRRLIRRTQRSMDEGKMGFAYGVFLITKLTNSLDRLLRAQRYITPTARELKEEYFDNKHHLADIEYEVQWRVERTLNTQQPQPPKTYDPSYASVHPSE
jgi:phytoene dehydrogenase-like protein